MGVPTGTVIAKGLISPWSWVQIPPPPPSLPGARHSGWAFFHGDGSPSVLITQSVILLGSDASDHSHSHHHRRHREQRPDDLRPLHGHRALPPHPWLLQRRRPGTRAARLAW